MIRSALRGGVRRVSVLGVTAVVSLGLLASTGAAAADPRDDRRGPSRVKVRMLALNDFHGQLQPSTSSSSGVIDGTPAGGAAYLATHLKKLRHQARRQGIRPLTVAAGDLIGASPLISAAFHDEPTVEAMNLMKLDVSAVGNHEFDEGWRELVRLQRGGCLDDGDGRDNQDSCPGGKSFDGADFRYLAANVRNVRTGRTVLPGVSIKRYRGVPVAFIGMTLEDTPNIVTKAGVEGLEFADEARTANRLSRKLYRAGVKAVVVLVHEGGYPTDDTAYNSCPGISGPIVDINKRLSTRIDAVVTGHTHRAYNCSLKDPKGKPRLVTSAASLGRLVTKIDLTVGKRTKEIVRRRVVADNVIVTRTVAENPRMADLIARYDELVGPIRSEVLGSLSGATSVTRDQDESLESPLGNLIADAQKADPSAVPPGGTAPEIAFMNPGGIRADLVANGAGEVTYGAAFDAQPFNNYMVSMDLTGAQILALLEEQWSGSNSVESPKVLQVSGLTYSWSESAPSGSRVVPGSPMVDGSALVPDRTYRVVANSFLADGGDGFGTFGDATGKYFGGLDIDALSAYLGANNPYTPVATDRIDKAP